MPARFQRGYAMMRKSSSYGAVTARARYVSAMIRRYQSAYSRRV